MSDYLKKLFIDEAKPALDRHSGGGSSSTVNVKSSCQGTVVPNTGYVNKIYFNDKLSANEVYNILSQLTYIETPFLTDSVYPILFANDGNPVMFVAKHIGDVSNLTYYDIYLTTDITNPEIAVRILNMNYPNNILIVEFNHTECKVNKEVINDYSGLLIGTENNILSQLVSTTPFTQDSVTLSGEYDGSILTVNEPGTIDIKTMIENDKHIPLKIVIDINKAGD